MIRQCVVSAFAWAMLAVPGLTAEWADKMFEIKSHDFGDVAHGAKAEFAFKFKNLYKEDVHVAAVSSSCGCTSPKYSDKPIKTHETSEILAVFNSGSFLGHKTATVTVTFDKPYYAEVQLQVAGNIRSDLSIEPGSIQFGQIEQGSGATKEVLIEYTGGDSWELKGVRNPYEDLFKVALAEVRKPGRKAYKLNVELLPQAAAGYVQRQLLLITGDGRASIPVMVEGRVMAAVTTTPASLYLGRVKVGESVTKRVVVRASKPFKIIGFKCADSCFQVELPEEAAARHLIPVTFTAGAQEGTVAKEITIQTDLGANIVTTLQCQAQVVPGDPTVAGKNP